MTGFYSKLDRFLARLPEGFEYGVRERVAVSQMVLGLAESGELPGDPVALKTLVAPVVCCTRAQQEEFYRLFESENWKDAAESELIGPGTEAPSRKPDDAKQTSSRRRWLKVAVVFAVVALVALAGAGGVAWYRLTRPIPALGWSPPPVHCCQKYVEGPDPPVRTGHVLTLDGAPIGGAEVRIPGQSTNTSPDGAFQFKLMPAGLVPVLVAQPKYRSFMQSMSGNSIEVHLGPWTATPRPEVGSLTQAGAARRFSMVDPVTVAINPADYLVAVAEDRRIQAFHFGALKQIPSLGPWIAGARFVFSPNGANVVQYTSTDIARPGTPGEVYDPSLAKILAVAAADAEPKSVLVAFSNEFIADLHDVVEGGSSDSLGSISEPVEGMTYLPPSTGKNLTALIAGQSSFWRLNYSPRDPKSTPVLQKLYTSPHSVPITAIQVDPGFHYLAIQDQNGTLDIWDFYGQRVQTPQNWPKRVDAFSFSSQSNALWVAAVDRTLFSRLDSLRWLAPILPAIVIALWIWWLVRKRGRLNRLSINRDLDTHSLSPPIAEPPFNGAPARRLGLEMRKRKQALSNDLAPRPTVHATARSAGFFSPMYAVRSRQREFLILIQKHGPGDQQELLYRSLVKSLENEYAFTEIYNFHSSPETIEDRSGGWTDLPELSARHADHELWIIADPAEFLDPFATSLPSWTQHLARWQSRTIFSPIEVDEGLRNLLEDDGVWVNSASVEGLAAVLASLDGEHSPSTIKAPVLPRVFRYLPLRWTERSTPGESAVQQAMEALPQFLGADGMLLAGACAVYPETFWGLTSWLSAALIPSQDRRTEALARLTSLPWFYFATIPNWMRAKLVKSVNRADKERVRVALETFLNDAQNKAGGLQFARNERGGNAQVRDYVLFSFLLGRDVDEDLAVKPPSRWLSLWFKGGRWFFGPRIATHIVLAIALGIASWYGASYALAFVPASVEVTQWSLPPAAPVVTPPARVFPTNTVQRVMLEIADSMVGSASPVAFEDTVVRQATNFIDNVAGTLTAFKVQRPAPGLFYNGGIIELVANGRMITIEPQNGVVARVDQALPRGPFSDYSDVVGSNPVRRDPSQCGGPAVDLDNWNRGAVDSGGKGLSFDTNGYPICVVSISTYHWNNGKGALPGRITLRNQAGVVAGSWQAEGSSGQNQAPNVNWTVNVPPDHPAVINGRYTVEDSSPETWSQNKDSSGLGFVRLHALRVTAATGVWSVSKRLTGHTDLVSDVVWSPDGKQVVSGSFDNTIRLWDASNGQTLVVLRGHSNGVESLAIGSAAQTIASGSKDGTIRLWKLPEGPAARVIDAKGKGIYSISWSADGKMLASGGADGTVRIWDPASGQLIRALDSVKGEVYRVAFRPDGKVLASSGEDNYIRLWNPGTGNLIQMIQTPAPGSTIAWNPSGKILSSGGVMDKIVRLWDAASGKQLGVLQGHTDQLDALAWSPDGRTLASSSADRTVRLWDPASGKLLTTLKDHTAEATGLAWSPDGKQLASAGGDNTILIYSQAPQPLTIVLPGSATGKR